MLRIWVQYFGPEDNLDAIPFSEEPTEEDIALFRQDTDERKRYFCVRFQEGSRIVERIYDMVTGRDHLSIPSWERNPVAPHIEVGRPLPHI
jgi:hypothetical protein